MLSDLLMHQKATLTVTGDASGLTGRLSITIAGFRHTFKSEGQSMGSLVSDLESRFITHDWSEGEPAVVTVRDGKVTVEEGSAVVVNWDNLTRKGLCPMCEVEVGYPYPDSCPTCGLELEGVNE